MNSISANLNIMIKASEKASKILIRDFGEIENLQVSKKGPTDFVTNSDLKTEKIIIDELKKAKPNYSIISEENGVEKNKDEKNTWIIDPIDGTVNFLHGIPHFAISIAHKSNDEIISGLIFDPIKNEMFFAEKNNGAYFNNHRIINHPIEQIIPKNPVGIPVVDGYIFNGWDKDPVVVRGQLTNETNCYFGEELVPLCIPVAVGRPIFPRGL